MRITATVDVSRLKAKLEAKRATITARLPEIVLAGAVPIEAQAKSNAPVVSGALRDSIDTQIVSQSETQVVAQIAPHTPYAHRIERGFIGIDSLGRNYHQPAEPYMRPAYEEKKQEAKDIMVTMIKELVRE